MAAALRNPFTALRPCFNCCWQEREGECSIRNRQRQTPLVGCVLTMLFSLKAVVYFSAISPAGYSGKCKSIVNQDNKMNYFWTQSI